MGLLEILTIIFVICKLIGVISWSWWLVFLPEIIAICWYVFWIVIYVLCFKKTKKELYKWDS
ncbi:hypothetical protein ACRW9N_13165 [Listeria aquatica]|uniref:hypothetical protein n=1 Tax=Listeria aquatica TaxID=1494960 RepID=UPI003EF39A3B